jgi:hypothetical protein
MGLEELLSKKLKENNISYDLTPWDEMTDAEFEIDEDVSIQVAGYCPKPYIVSMWNEDKTGILHVGEYGINELDKLIKKVKEIA